MEQHIAEQLVDINRKFYVEFAQSFSSTRLRLQPGVKRILAQIGLNTSVLDLGCGNGEVCIQLHKMGFQGFYLGIDFSANLVKIANERWSEYSKNQKIIFPSSNTVTFGENKYTGTDPIFLVKDITCQEWYTDLPIKGFDTVLLFAVMHHIPGNHLRNNLLGAIYKLLTTEGDLYHSEWQFLKSPKLRSRIIPWEMVGLNEERVDLNDYLLDWRHDGYSLRYVHHFSAQELELLAEANNFSIANSFLSDGESGKLGLYQKWHKD